MIVVGGSYLEICVVPEWYRLFGSGGRAALVLASLSNDVDFHTYACKQWADDVEQTMGAAGIKPRVHRIEEDVSFSYFHPLSEAHLNPEAPSQYPPFKISGDTVLRFGFVEGDAIVNANYATFDPQGGKSLAHFEKNGSKAQHVAYVLNEREILALSGRANLNDAVADLFSNDCVDAIVVKRGTEGATVFQREGRNDLVPAYRSETIFKIGSGDVFSAIFAYQWGERRVGPAEAADFASRVVAHYVETRSLQVPTSKELAQRIALPIGGPKGFIYLAGPFFTIANRWLVEEALASIENLGGSVFSPLHDVGFGTANDVAAKDLAGLRSCTAVLALIDGGDPGTLFEVGYARNRNMPVVAFGEKVTETDLTMLIGSGCEVVHDFTTAIYRAIWAAQR
jgi:nucleoside 2-deoxyribosyltransferase